MVKIKQKKKLNLPQLIEWVVENKKFGCTYISDNFNKVIVTDDGIIEFGGSFYRDIFKVEEEREINEHTILNKLVVRYRNDDIYIFPQERIDDFKNDSSIVAFYIPNDDLTMTLIWRNGKLVE